MGRPKSTKPRRNLVGVRLTDEEQLKLDTLTEALDTGGMSATLVLLLNSTYEDLIENQGQ